MIVSIPPNNTDNESKQWICNDCLSNSENEMVYYIATLTDAKCERCGKETKAKNLCYVDKKGD